MQHMERKHNRTDGILLKAGLVEQLERQRGSDGDLLKIEAEVEDGVAVVGKLEGAVIS